VNATPSDIATVTEARPAWVSKALCRSTDPALCLPCTCRPYAARRGA
jgi:hypothetical protein